jgi:DNA-binding response OmpR family regulator
MVKEAQRSLDIVPDVHVAAVDDRLFSGENPNTEHAGDAAHWMTIYRELIAFHEGVLSRNGHGGSWAPEDPAASMSLDVAALRSQLKNYRRRLDFWSDRHWELRGLAIDGRSRQVTHGEHGVHLTRREFQLLSFFADHPSQTFTASVLAERAWSDARLSNDQVRIYVARLRARLAALGQPCRLVSHPRLGYSFDCD